MNILLDECTPRVVKKHLAGQNVRTVQELGWAGVKNGELLMRAEPLFEVFITTDKNLRHQQNLDQLKLAFVLLPSNKVPVIVAVIPALEAVLRTIKSGDFIEIPLP